MVVWPSWLKWLVLISWNDWLDLFYQLKRNAEWSSTTSLCYIRLFHLSTKIAWAPGPVIRSGRLENISSNKHRAKLPLPPCNNGPFRTSVQYPAQVLQIRPPEKLCHRRPGNQHQRMWEGVQRSPLIVQFCIIYAVCQMYYNKFCASVFSITPTGHRQGM